jgi:hypothetical protein
MAEQDISIDGPPTRTATRSTSLGATHSDMSPPRPKYMRRRTYTRIWLEMPDEAALMYRAHLGADFPEIGG